MAKTIKQTNLKELFAEYVSECQYTMGLRPETIRGYKAVFRTFSLLTPHVKNTQALTTTAMNEFFKVVQTRKRTVGKDTEKVGVKASTIRTYWSKLNSFFEWLRLRGYMEVNPLSMIKTAAPVYDDKKAVEKDGMRKIITAITLHSSNSLLLKRDMLMLNILLFCGLRRSELISLEVRDVDIEKRTLTIRAETSKSKRTRVMPINPPLMMHLQEYILERNKRRFKTPYLLVSGNEDRGLSVHGLKHWVKRLNDLSGVRFHLHQFRHSFACELAKRNVNAVNMQKLMGHSDLRMTERYVRSLTVDDLRNDVNMLNIDNFI
ncbi:MAG: site-specific integrase [Minisyncoccia bacterium]